jgi:hypothetical protein
MVAVKKNVDPLKVGIGILIIGIPKSTHRVIQ